MGRQSRWTWILSLGGVLALVVLLAALWALTPEDLRGPYLLVSGVVTLVIYIVLYAVQRRRHW